MSYIVNHDSTVTDIIDYNILLVEEFYYLYKMEDEDIGTVDIYADLFDNDLDDLCFEPEVIDDSCDESAELYDYYKNH